jgi:hypothetical protein
MEPWLTELPDHQMTLLALQDARHRGLMSGQPRAQCSCGWSEGSVTVAGIYDLIRSHLTRHGWTPVSAQQ